MTSPSRPVKADGAPPTSDEVPVPPGPPEQVDVTTGPGPSTAAVQRPVDEHLEGSSRSGDAPAPPGSVPALPALLEAVLLVADEPIAAVTLAQVAERPTDEVERALRQLSEDYEQQARGFELRPAAGGWRLYTRAACAPWVERFVAEEQQARLSQAALETLAVIAYRQPVTRGRISAVRGVNVDSVVRTLLTRGLVVETGHDRDSGAVQYGTTGLLLEKFGIDSLAELPSLAPLLPELADIETDWTST